MNSSHHASLGSPGGMEDLHRLVVRVAAAGGWAAALLLATVATVTGNQVMLFETLGPLAAALFFTAQLLTGRTNAAATLTVGVLVVVITHALVGSAPTTLAAAVSVVAMAVMAAAFVRRHVLAYLVVAGPLVFAVPLLWPRSPDTPFVQGTIATGVTMALSFLIGSLAFVMVRNSALRMHRRFRRLFEVAPVGLMEQDWSEALDHARAEGLDLDADADLRGRMESDPDLLRSIVGRVQVTRVNQAVIELTEVGGAGRLLGPVAPQRVAEGSDGLWIQLLAAMLAGVGVIDHEYETETFRGHRKWLSVRSIPSPDSLPGRILLAVSDVTTLKQAQEALAEAVEAKNRFIASVSHELRTPLTVVVGLASELADGDGLSPIDRSELMRLIASQSREMQYIIEDLLVSARADIGAVTVGSQPVDLVEQTYAVVSELGSEPEAVAIEGVVPPADADPVRVRQIIRNLIVNANRYGGPHRRVVLSSRDGAVVFEMRDDGTPLPAEDRDRIFAPYERAHDRPGVTASVGLGLSVSRQLARLMGGELVYDHDGETVFRLTLPVSPVPALAAAAR
ncbi:MAG: HAMP domain-containing sensor histidine kinase [Acidimicrobiia bacterium]